MITACWPQTLLSPSAMKRASTSGVEPGGASEMMVTGFSGYLTACACAASEHANRPKTARPIQYRRAIMSFSGLVGAARIRRSCRGFYRHCMAAPNRHAFDLQTYFANRASPFRNILLVHDPVQVGGYARGQRRNERGRARRGLVPPRR